MKTILITDYAWPDVEIESQVIESAGFKLVAGPQVAAPDDVIAELASRHCPSAIMTCWANVNAAAINACPDLEIVARLGVGLDNIDRAAAAARGVVVTNVPDYCVEEVSDHAVALLLAFARGVAVYDRDTKAGGWSPSTARLSRVRDMTIGVAGMAGSAGGPPRRCPFSAPRFSRSIPVRPPAPRARCNSCRWTNWRNGAMPSSFICR